MPRSTAGLLRAAIVGSMLAALPAATLAAQPDRQHVIVSNTADAAFSTLDGCIVTEVFVSSMDGAFQGSPGGAVNKQGLSSVLIVISDTCQEPIGKGFPKLFEGIGQTLDPLAASSAAVEWATLEATIPVFDEVSGATYDVDVDLAWTAISTATHDTTRVHVAERQAGIVNSAANNWAADAAAYGSVLLEGVNLTPSPTFDAHLGRVKQNCLVVSLPHGATDFDCS
ncbi:MAG: hypothetical protein ABR509_01955 [Candidatus Limnocylindria bacterium]